MRAWWFPRCFWGGSCIASLVLPNGGYTPGAAQATGATPGAALGGLYQNSLTLGVFFVLIGYYLYYYSYVLWKFKHVEREPASTAGAGIS